MKGVLFKARVIPLSETGILCGMCHKVCKATANLGTTRTLIVYYYTCLHTKNPPAYLKAGGRQCVTIFFATTTMGDVNSSEATEPILVAPPPARPRGIEPLTPP